MSLSDRIIDTADRALDKVLVAFDAVCGAAKGAFDVVLRRHRDQ